MKKGQSDIKTVVIGIGNAILSDDSVGIKAVNMLKSMHIAGYGAKKETCGVCEISNNNGKTSGFKEESKNGRRSNFTEFIEVSSGGINLMEYMAGFNRAVIIDAIVTGRHKAGTIFKFIYPNMPYTRNTVSTHDMDLPMALEMGKYLGIALPSTIIIFAIEAEDTVTFGEGLTKEVEISLGRVVDEIKLLLN
ncbi:MAG: hydrogenase maturation protease [Candidatus Acidulodesulfobacterium sp.]